MSILSWNCQGLEQPCIVQELTWLVRPVCSSIVFLSETRQQKERVQNLKNRLGMNNCFIVDGRGKGGGLVLFWKQEIKIWILSYAMHHVDTLIWDGSHHAAWRGTFIYGEPRTQDRHQMWQLLRRIKPCQLAPWLMIGDFNEVMWLYEHFSQWRRPPKQMMDFCEVLSFCDLHDIGFQGLPWTYDNKQTGERNVCVRLDRAVASPSWSQWFQGGKLKHLTMVSSDHCPILLYLMCTDEQDYEV
jgi:hypothetical protein